MKIFRLLILMFCFFLQSNPMSGQIDIGYRINHLGTLDRQVNLSAKIYFDDKLVIEKYINVSEYIETRFIERGFLIYEQFPDGCKCRNIKLSIWSSISSGQIDTIVVPMYRKEKRVEFETKITKNSYGYDMIGSTIAKKIYELPNKIQYFRVWKPKIGNAPKYFIENHEHYILHGQAIDNSFEGKLYRKIEDDTWERIYTGGYGEKKYPSKSLYSNDFVISFIRDERDIGGLFEVDSIGEYKYQAYLGFDSYKQSEMTYGRMPNENIHHWESYPKNRIQEYYEIVDYFKIE